jgi:hypothetical protein
MPRVPTIDTPGVQSRPIATPYEGRPNPEAFGVGFGQDLERVGTSLGRAADTVATIRAEEREKTNTALLFDAYAKLGQWHQPNLYDTKTGYLATHGEDALGDEKEPLAQKKLQDFDKYAKSIDESFGSNQEVRQKFKEVFRRERESVVREVTTHERREYESVQEEKFRGALTQAISNGVNFYDPNRPESTESAKQLGEGAILVMADQRGWPKEQTEAELRKFRTTLHLSILDKLTDADTGDPVVAAKYLKDNGPEIDGEVRERSKVDQAVAKAGIRAKSVETANAIADKVGDDEAAQFAALKEIPNVELRDATLTRLQQRNALMKASRNEKEKQTYGRVRIQVEKASGWLDETTNDFNALSDDGQADARAYARVMREHMAMGTAADRKAINEANAIALREFSRLSIEDPNKALAFDFDSASGVYQSIDKPTRAQLELNKTKLRKDITDGSIIKRQGLMDLVREATRGLKKDDSAALEQKMLEFWNGHGDTRPTTKEAREELARLRKDYIVPGFIWDSTKKGYKLKPEETDKARPKDEPAAPAAPAPARKAGGFDLEAGEDPSVRALKAAGIANPTPEQIEEHRRRRAMAQSASSDKGLLTPLGE